MDQRACYRRPPDRAQPQTGPTTDNGSVPTTLAAVVFSAPPEDGYGHPLQLIPLGASSWELWSPGSDGRVGGQGHAADVTWSMLRGELHEADSL